MIVFTQFQSGLAYDTHNVRIQREYCKCRNFRRNSRIKTSYHFSYLQRFFCPAKRFLTSSYVLLFHSRNFFPCSIYTTLYPNISSLAIKIFRRAWKWRLKNTENIRCLWSNLVLRFVEKFWFKSRKKFRFPSFRAQNAGIYHEATIKVITFTERDPMELMGVKITDFGSIYTREKNHVVFSILLLYYVFLRDNWCDMGGTVSWMKSRSWIS